MILLTSVFCVVLSLEFGVAIPKGNRFKESHLRNEGTNEFKLERHTGGPTNPHNNPNNENELIYQKNQKNVLMNNENYEKVYSNNNPAVFRNVNEEQQSAIFESKEYNQNTAERNINNFNEESPRSSYIGSLPQVNRVQSFRSKGEVNHEANMPRMVDILSEVNDPNNDSAPIGSKTPTLQEKNLANQIMNKYSRQNVQVPENLNEKEEEETTLSDVPVATPEYIQSLYNEDKHIRKNNVKPTITNLPRHYISNKNLQTNSQNVNEATFQNPSAEILYETGQAKPYEISNEPPINSRQGNTNAQKNILKDKQRLKNLYLSSKPTKHYMIVYPDGRVEQVDQLDKIQKVHPNYVMLNAKELLQHGKPNTINTGSQKSVVEPNVQTATTNTIQTQSSSVKDTKDDEINKVPQTVNKQILPVPNELPVATESPIISTTEVVETNNDVPSTNDQLKESEISDSQEKNKLSNNENTISGAIVTTSDYSNIEFSTTSTTETSDTEDIVTTVRSTISTPTTDTEIINQNNSDPLSPSNNTDNSNLSKDPEANNTSGDNLINTKDGSVLDENTTPTPKQESNEDGSVKNTTTVTTDLNTIKENSYTTDRIETSNVNNEQSTNSSSLDSSVNKKETNSTTESNNETVITSEDGIDSDGNTFHIEKIVTNNTNESTAQNLESNNVTSSDSNTLVTKSNPNEIENSTTENTKNNINLLNVTSSNSLTKKEENNTDTTTIQTLTNVTNSEVDGTKKDDNNLKRIEDKPNNNSDTIYTNASSFNTPDEAYDVNSAQGESNANKTLSTNIKQDGSKLTDDGTDDSKALPTKKPNVDNEENDNTAKDVSNGGAVSTKEEDSTAPFKASDDLYYLSPPQKVVPEDDEDDDDDDVNNETGPETINIKDNLDQESPSNDETIVNESSFWFNANESFWKKLMSSNEHNSFYFLFPRPQPNTKETKKIIYPNGTVVVETTETVDNGDGETNSTKTVLSCGNCTTCDKTL